MALLLIPEVYEPLFTNLKGRFWRIGGLCALGSLVVATLLLLHSVWQEDTIRLSYIAQEASMGKKVVSVPYSTLSPQRCVLRHVAYDDFDAGLTRDPVCDYYGLKEIRLDRTMSLAEIAQQP